MKSLLLIFSITLNLILGSLIAINSTTTAFQKTLYQQEIERMHQQIYELNSRLIKVNELLIANSENDTLYQLIFDEAIE
ncbi:hypothetical protein [Phaeocystidibacter marisrubri]|uniref:Uncharacterized protein n=1 Tax=Phaeocystidibacter marisrubri TaxID=1577780 RepID=A0A6L3ZHA8_9FLAO|nr:hypothetical protein [Phaeocystidibacter marisrubri]KAB2816968.1 hypothetical protein F8C82_00795 [Phaeocystidibacter marisrubri]